MTVRPRRVAPRDGSDSLRVSGRPPRVLLVTHHFPRHISGIGNVVAEEAQSLARRGNDAVVLTTTSLGRSGSLPPHHDFRMVRVPACRGPERWGVPCPMPGPQLVPAAHRQTRWADRVHANDAFDVRAWAAALAAKAAACQFIVTRQASLVGHPSVLVRGDQRVVYRAVGFRTLRTAPRVIVVNSRVGDFVVDNGVDGDRVLLIPNGVDTLRFRPAQAGSAPRSARDTASLLIGYRRCFEPKQGLGQLLAAGDDAYAIVCVAGNRPAGAPETAGVRCLGALPQNQVAELLRAADLFVLPSHSGGLPLTAQEAMASGLRIVLRDDPGYAPYGVTAAGVRFVDGSPDTLRAMLGTLPTLQTRAFALAKQRASTPKRDSHGRITRGRSKMSGMRCWTNDIAQGLRRAPVTRLAT